MRTQTVLSDARTVGVVSDTHGLLRAEALRVLRGSALIVHAGDVGGGAVLDGLRAIAPVVAVRGNNDRGPWARALPERVRLVIAPFEIYVLHDVKALGADPATARVDLVIAGHSHRPSLGRAGRALVLNPGSIGPRRFTLPVALARLRVGSRELRIERLELDLRRAGTGRIVERSRLPRVAAA